MKRIEGNREIPQFEKERADKAWDDMMTKATVGFVTLPFRDAMWDQTQKLANELRGRFKSMVNVGIGGSAVGAQALYSALGGDRKLYFCDNVDQGEFDRLVDELNFKETVFVVISKSGNTIETLMATDLLVQKCQNLKLKWQEHFVVITEKKANPLFDWASKNELSILELPQDVGGRFSVLTPVGMLPAAFVGHDLSAYRAGARAALLDRESALDFAALAFDSWEREEWITMLWAYTGKLRGFGNWFSQLWAESLAKSKDRGGTEPLRCSTPFFATGACDQHSLLQQVIEGSKDKWNIILEVLEAQQVSTKLQKSQFSVHKYLEGKGIGDLMRAECRATYEAMVQSNVSVELWQVEKIDAQTIGRMFMFYQLVIALLGELMDINAFDQPGVELGKSLAKKALSTPEII
jgi:glucose-6-phosphate isomerase